MPWPWSRKKTETRRGGYAPLLLGQFEAAAAGDGTGQTALATSVVEAAISLYARSLAAARVDAPAHVLEAVTPSMLATTARSMLRAGESFWRIDLTQGRLRLSPAGFAYPYGKTADPFSWTYQFTEYGPSGSVTGWYPSEQVIHCRYAIDPIRPWAGVPPWQWSGVSASAQGAIEAVMRDQARAPHGQLLGLPESPEIDEGGDIRPMDAFRSDMADARGRTLVTEHSGQWAGSTGSPSRLDHVAFGLAFDKAAGAMSESAMTLAAAFGVAPSLLTARSDGSAQRESFRRFLHTSLSPLARLIEEELTRKLEAPVTLDLTDIHAADVAGRARAFRSLVDAGLSEDQALRIVGINEEGA